MYNLPRNFISLVSNIYCLSASICSQHWTTAAFPLELGVLQGDPLSVTVSTTVMNTYIDAVKPFFHEGYNFCNSTKKMTLLQYADDSCIVTNGPAACQAILDRTSQWLTWTGMKVKVKVNKCQSVAIKVSNGHVYDPQLTITGEKVSFIGRDPVKFLGGILQIPSDHHSAHQLIEQKLSLLLSRVDQVAVTRRQKLQLYKYGVCPRLTWDLTITNFPISWISKYLDPCSCYSVPETPVTSVQVC